MKRVITTTLTAVLILLSLAGCDKNFMPTGAEITTFEIVRVLGIDKSEENPNEVGVTIVAERAEQAGAEDFGSVTYEIITATGATAFEAVTKLRNKSDKKHAFGYVDYIIFGESAVKDDLTKYVDFPLRNPEFRLSPNVFVAKGGTAKDLLAEASSEDVLIVDSLDNLSTGINLRSDVKRVRLIELINMLNREDVAAVLPALGGREPEDEKLLGGDLPEKRLYAAGYAVIRDFKLAGYFDDDSARGYNYLTNLLRTSAYSVSDGCGSHAGLDVLSAGMEMIPRFADNRLIGVTCIVHVNAGLTEQRSQVNLNTEAGLEYLSRELSRTIEAELESAVEQSKDFGIDCFGIGERIKLRHPYRWRHIESRWRKVYQGLDIDVVAEATVRRAYALNEPGGFPLYEWGAKHPPNGA
ncbi:MAG: Ger(x)C family spore germination protein [Oscillospiraceae bacterium]|nr:Ger(x)C family spore germination protein [Oscillospiraceae bacterium]